jgi:GT2 family glycosyltransferase
MAKPGASAVGIVLVNYNGMRFMPDCLASLQQIDEPHARIVVVDNASTDGSAAWVAARYPEITLIQMPTNQGITGGNNAGIQWCLANGCEYILLLNNDTVVEPDFLRHMLCHADSRTLVVPRIYYYDNRQLLNSHIGHFDFWRGVNVQYLYGKPESPSSRQMHIVTMASTCAMLIPKAIIEDVGIMDDAYFLYYDDTDFIARAVNGGAVIKYIPNAVIYHRESSSSGGWTVSPLSMYYNTRNRLYFMFKHQRLKPILTFFLLYFFVGRGVMVARYILRGEIRMASALCKGIADFFRGNMGQAPAHRFSERPAR